MRLLRLKGKKNDGDIQLEDETESGFDNRKILKYISLMFICYFFRMHFLSFISYITYKFNIAFPIVYIRIAMQFGSRHALFCIYILYTAFPYLHWICASSTLHHEAGHVISQPVTWYHIWLVTCFHIWLHGHVIPQLTVHLISHLTGHVISHLTSHVTLRNIWLVTWFRI